MNPEFFFKIYCMYEEGKGQESDQFDLIFKKNGPGLPKKVISTIKSQAKSQKMKCLLFCRSDF